MPQWLLDLFARYGYAVVFGGVFLENTGLPVPGETALLAGAALAHNGQLSFLWVVVVAIAGATLGDNLGFFIGRRGGRQIAERHGWRIGLTRERLAEFDRFFDRHGPKTVFAARFIDRIGKGIRGAPRDAYVADITAPEERGAAYGLRQSLDTAGAFAGPLIAIALMLLWKDDLRRVMWIAVIPAFVALAILFVWVREPPRPASMVGKPLVDPLALSSWRRFPFSFWKLLVVVALFTLMRFSEAFLVLRGQSAGFDAAYAPLALVVMSAVYMLSAWPAGVLSDRMPRLGVLVVGCLVMLGADLLLAFGDGKIAVLIGIGLWGLHMGLTEGLLAAYVADDAPEDLRGSAFGAMNLVRGVLLLVASVVAGALWAHGGPRETFLAGAAMATITMLAAAVLLRRPDAPRDSSA